MGRESGMVMDGDDGWMDGDASLQGLSETVRLRHGDRNK